MMPSNSTQHQPREDDGLLFGCLLNGTGSAKLVGWREVETWRDGGAPLWVHLDRESPRVQHWLMHLSGLTAQTVEALLAEETRPRVFRGKRGFVTILRGVNSNPGEEPDDMIAMRMWSDGQRVITIRQQKLLTTRDVLAQLIELETGPKTASDLYERLIFRINEKMSDTVESYDEQLDRFEDQLDVSRATEQRRQLSELRQSMNNLRRYIWPQKEALGNLLAAPPDWFTDECRLRLRETIDRLLRYIEEIDAARERAVVAKDDIANQLAEATNKTLYILAIVSGVFLPLAFLTGLLGINVGGMPGVENDNAFWIFCGVMTALLGLELLIFKRLKWL